MPSQCILNVFAKRLTIDTSICTARLILESRNAAAFALVLWSQGHWVALQHDVWLRIRQIRREESDDAIEENKHATFITLACLYENLDGNCVYPKIFTK